MVYKKNAGPVDLRGRLIRPNESIKKGSETSSRLEV